MIISNQSELILSDKKISTSHFWSGVRKADVCIGGSLWTHKDSLIHNLEVKFYNCTMICCSRDDHSEYEGRTLWFCLKEAWDNKPFSLETAGFLPTDACRHSQGKWTTTLPGCYYLQLRMRETVTSLADGRILGVRFSELSVGMIKLTWCKF